MGQGRDHSPITALGKADTTQGNSLIGYKSTWSRIMGKQQQQNTKKKNLKNTSLPAFWA